MTIRLRRYSAHSWSAPSAVEPRRRGRRTRRAGVLAASTMMAVSLIGAAAVPSGASARRAAPRVGGTINIGGLLYTVLYPGAAGYSAAVNSEMQLVYGTLFSATRSGDTYVGNLASSYAYKDGNRVLVIDLRPGIRFQDGTPLNAAAVVWNFRKYSQPTSIASQYFALATSIKATGRDQVTIDFSQPYTLLIPALADTEAGFMASPTAYNRMGATNFATSPVGAGPFRISSVSPGEQVTMTRFGHYLDAKHIYLQQINWKNTGTSDSAQYVDLQSGALQEIPLLGALDSPSVIQQADQNSQFKHADTANTFYIILPINTYAPPFNNKLAREALDYCMNRVAIAKYTTERTTSPAFVLSGFDSAYLSGWQDGEKLMPYPYDPAKGRAIVKQLGGLSFTFRNSIVQGIPTALQQEWEACGMKVNLVDVAPSQIVAQEVVGAYQIDITVTPNPGYNPGLYTTYQTPTTPLDSHGFNDPTVVKLFHEADATSSNAAATTIWHQAWKRIDTDAVSMPVVSMSVHVVYSHCLSGVRLYPDLGGPNLTYAYLTCSV